MRLEYDKQADAIYIYLNDAPYAYTKRLDDMRYVDYASDKTPIGVELLGVSWGVNIGNLPYAQEIAKLLAISGIRAYSMLENEQTETAYSEKPVILSEETFFKSIFVEFKWPLADQTAYVLELRTEEVTA